MGEGCVFELQVAVLSDVHGNRWALEAVLSDIERRSIQDIVNLGDCLYGPLDPGGTAEILIKLDLLTVRGNEDRILIESGQDPHSPSLDFARCSLRPEHLAWLASLKMNAIAYRDLFLCHGSPEQDDEYLLRCVSEIGVSLRESGELAQKLSFVKQPVVLCGHDHLPQAAHLLDGRLVVNPGSVGCPAYADDLPFPHVMEAGTPHARYAIVSKGKADWQIEHVAVPYDWQTAAAIALENGRPDWAQWLATGRAAP
jgi:predicted phosphodiesterase